jgi:hypothetical protein
MFQTYLIIFWRTNMTNSTQNPILIFIDHLAEAVQVLWNKFYKALNIISWGRFFLYSFLTLLVGSILHIGSLAWLGVLTSFIIKCFFGEEDKINNIETSHQTNNEE